MKVTLINPPIVDRRGNITTAITIPLGIAYLASYLRSRGICVELIDAPGLGINRVEIFRKDFLLRGITYDEIVERISPDTDLIGISAVYSPQHNSLRELVVKIRNKYPKIPIVMGGNHVTLYYRDFFDDGIDYVVLNEGESSLYQLCLCLQGRCELSGIDGIVYKKKRKLFVNKKRYLIKNLDSIPFPSRDLLLLENYFKARMGHSPANKRFTPIIATRGCPFNCSFCASSLFWKNSWRARSPRNIVDEIEQCVVKYNIREFQFEDDNLTLDKKMIIDLCDEIIDRNLAIEWCVASGLRPENVDRELLVKMKEAGCKHIAVAPETGSPRVLKEVFNKGIDLGKILEITKNSDELGIRTAAYILISNFETAADRKLTLSYLKELAVAGLDELGAFPVIPYPGTAIAKRFPSLQDLNKWEELITGKIPNWYPDYKSVKRFRTRLYATFFLYQLFYHPAKLFRLVENLILRRQETKTDRSLQNLIRRPLGKASI